MKYLSCSLFNITFRADPKHDENALTIYYTTTDPEDSTSIVNLFTSSTPFTTHKEFDPELGDHDGFLISGPYIFAQRTDAGKVNLYVSYMRKPFQLAKIPTPYNHQNYYVSDIDELQAMVVIEHEGGFYNLYLSDTTGVYFSLSLRDVVVENGIRDIEVVRRCNTFVLWWQYVHVFHGWTRGLLFYCVFYMLQVNQQHLLTGLLTGYTKYEFYPHCTSDQWSEWYLDC